MKILHSFIKTFIENLRDWKILILVVVFAPFFVYLMYMYMGNTQSSRYSVAVINNDKSGSYASELIYEWEHLVTEDSVALLKIQIIPDTITGRKLIKNKNADLLVTIPGDFTESLTRFLSAKEGQISPLVSYGDQSNVRFMVAASFIDYITYGFVGVKTNITVPFNVKYEYAGRGKSLNEFDLYIPALLVLSVIMILFTAGASIVREFEKETIIRLTLSNLTSFQFLTALTLNQIIIGLICILLTLLASFSVGYTTTGSIPLLIFVGTLTCFSVIGISIITACFIDTMFGLLTLGCFPFFILMFFSDCFIPLPKVNLFNIIGNQVYLNDLLPTATATRAFNKIMNYNSGISDVSFEIIWILAISALYFFIGVWLFKRRFKN
jgi:ABC-2 type transport system permease protein